MVRSIIRRQRTLSRRDVKKSLSMPFPRIKKVQSIPYTALAIKTGRGIPLSRKRKNPAIKRGISRIKAQSPESALVKWMSSL
jgi:hypothetical protein